MLVKKKSFPNFGAFEIDGLRLIAIHTASLDLSHCVKSCIQFFVLIYYLPCLICISTENVLEEEKPADHHLKGKMNSRSKKQLRRIMEPAQYISARTPVLKQHGIQIFYYRKHHTQNLKWHRM